MISKELVVEHVEYIKNREQKLSKEEDVWDVGVARAHEFDVMSGKIDYQALQNSKLIEFEVLDIE